MSLSKMLGSCGSEVHFVHTCFDDSFARYYPRIQYAFYWCPSWNYCTVYLVTCYVVFGSVSEPSWIKPIFFLEYHSHIALQSGNLGFLQNQLENWCVPCPFQTNQNQRTSFYFQNLVFFVRFFWMANVVVGISIEPMSKPITTLLIHKYP